MLVVWSCAVRSSLLSLDMIEKVNAKLPDGEKFEVWWSRSEGRRFIRVFESLYPSDPLLRNWKVTSRISVGCWLIIVCIFVSLRWG